jgi:hypothetical protein
MKIFKSFYLESELEGSIGLDYLIEKNSYYGGMCVLYRKICNKELYCYDINSCYPASMLELMPYKFEDEIDYDIDMTIVNHYLYKIDYEFNDDQIISNLPTRIDDEVIYIKKNNNKWHWGNEINTAIELGLKYLKIYRVRRYKGKEIFKEFIEDIYKLRLDAKKEKNICLTEFYKLLMNSLYGKFGQQLYMEKNIVSITELYELVEYYNAKKIKNITILDNNCVEYEYEDLKQMYNQIGSLVRFSSFITAQARCLLLKPFSDKIINQEDLFYTDTDSIFINKRLPNEYVSNEELGKFKLEFIGKGGVFLAPKMYMINLENNEIKMRMKGVPKKYIKEDNFTNILVNGIETINYTYFKRYFSEIYIGEISKRIILKNYKRLYFNNGNSKIWDSIDDFLNKKNETIKGILASYPSNQKIIKTEEQLMQSKKRKEDKELGDRIESLIKNTYIMTYEEFYRYITSELKDKDVVELWNNCNKDINNNENDKDKKEYDLYNNFLIKTVPLYIIPRNSKRKLFGSLDMMKALSRFILSEDYSKSNYYNHLSQYLIYCKSNEKKVIDLEKLKTESTRSEILEYYNNYKENNPTFTDYACQKKTLYYFCKDLDKKNDLQGKSAHVSDFYKDMMTFYFNYLLNNS